MFIFAITFEKNLCTEVQTVSKAVETCVQAAEALGWDGGDNLILGLVWNEVVECEFKPWIFTVVSAMNFTYADFMPSHFWIVCW